MNWLFRLLGKRPATCENTPEEQAVLIRLDGASLPDEVYEQHDLWTLEEQLRAAIGDLGEYDGHESGATDTIIYLYGKDAEAVFGVVEPVLKAYPLARGAVVTIRKGPPGAPQREVHIPR